MLATLAPSIPGPLAALRQTVWRWHIGMMQLVARMTVLQQDVRHVIVEHALLLLAIDHRLGNNQAVGAHRTGTGGIRTNPRQDIAGSQAVAHLDAGGTVEAGLEIIANHPEVGQSHPAGLHCTRAGHAVALTLLTHLGLDVLQMERRTGRLFISMTLLGSLRIAKLAICFSLNYFAFFFPVARLFLLAGWEIGGPPATLLQLLKINKCCCNLLCACCLSPPRAGL